MKYRKKVALASALAITLTTLSACQKGSEPVDGGAETSSVGLKHLPISINAAMVGITDQSADYIWAVGNGDLPKDQHDWDLVRGAVYDMILSGQILQVPGTGEFDAQWVTNKDWQQHAETLTKIGQDALPLAEAKSEDVEAWRAIGNRLIDNCLACHKLFKPDVPSQGIMHESMDREALGKSIFD